MDFTDDDTLIGSLIPAARQHLETCYSRAFVTQTWNLYPPSFPSWQESGTQRESHITIPLGILQGIVSFAYTDVAGNVTTWTVSGSDLLNENGAINAHIDTKSDPGRIVLAYGQLWPVAVLKTSNPIAIQFTAGFGAAVAVPTPIKQSILLLIGEWYKNREASVVGRSQSIVELPFAVRALMANYNLS